jgi:DinB superfamily
MSSADAFLGETTDLLRRTPEVLRALLGGLPESWGSTADIDGGWRPRHVVGHLISAELDDWIPRTRRILLDGTSKSFDKFDRHAHIGRDDDESLDQLLDRFAGLRRESLLQLDALVTDADLDRRGYHPALGEATLRELLATWAVHDLDHSAQVYAGMAGSRDADVGPWKAYLGILLRREDPAAVAG